MSIMAKKKINVNKPEARRAVDLSGWETLFPASAKLEEELLERGHKWEDNYFETSRKIKLGTRTLIPPTEEDSFKIGLVCCNGFTDSLRWFAKTNVLKYADQGFLVTGCEPEGHGFSDGKLGLITNLLDLAKDLHEFIKVQQKKYKCEKWVMHGESMGGMLTLLEVLESNKEKEVQIDGIILVSPMIKLAKKVDPSPVGVAFVSLLAKIFGSAAPPGKINPKALSENQELIKQVMADPIRYHGIARFKSILAMHKSTVFVKNRLGEIDVPFFVIHGAGDLITSPEASQKLFDESSKVDEKDKKILLVPGGSHGVIYDYDEKELQEIWKSVYDFIKAR